MDHTETRRFKMHPQLLFDVIKRQAGTLAKAILEGVMNSVDAKATKCIVTLDSKKLSIVDDGQGMTERRTIEEFFETFGTPHTESEKKTYGTFRMGRGQLFAFGRNHWKTGPFEMHVDIQKDGLDYKLKDLTRIGSNGAPAEGCAVEVELYEELLPSALLEAIRTIKVWVKYCPIPVVLNDIDVTVDPSKEKWDHITDEAWIRLNDAGELSIYNLGVFVMALSNYQMGTGGVVVTKKQVKVNFARNDVQHDCPVWKKLRPFLVKEAEDKMKKERLQPHERARLCAKFLEDPKSSNALWTEKLVVLSDGKTISLKALEPWGQWHEKHARTITCAKDYSVTGDRLMQRKLAVVISHTTLESFGFTPDFDGLTKFMDMVQKAEKYAWHKDRKWVMVPLESIETRLKGKGEILELAKLDIRTRTWVAFIERVYRWAPGGGKRAIRVGRMEGADAWTDGKSYIAFSHDYLKSCGYSLHGIMRVLYVLMHEEAHEDGTLQGHIHGVEFWERLEQLNRTTLPTLWQQTPAKLLLTLQQSERQMNKYIASICDRAEKIDRQGRKNEELERRVETAKLAVAGPVTPKDPKLPETTPPTKPTPRPKKKSKGEQSLF